LDHWEERWADTRIHGTTKRQVAAMFAQEKPCLLPLPVEPFRYYQYGERVVHLDGCVEVEAAYYGAPGWMGRVAKVQRDSLFVRLLDPRTGQLLREHVRQKRGWYRIKEDDRTKRTPLGTSQLLWRAGPASPSRACSKVWSPKLANQVECGRVIALDQCLLSTIRSESSSWIDFAWTTSDCPSSRQVFG
jgi:hypothetical protein